MGVVDGSAVNASNTNSAFINKNQADTMPYVLTLGKELVLTQITTPTTPATGYTKLYSKSDGNIYYMSPTGVEVSLGLIGPTKGGTGISTYTTGDVLYASATNTLSKLPIGTNGKILTVSSGVPVWANPAAGSYNSPTIQIFTANGGATNYQFAVTSANATIGAIYTNNTQTFTVLSTISSGLNLLMSGTGTPTAGGTLTKSSGTGDATITFSAYNTVYIPPVSPAPLYIEVEMIGGGGGGGMGNTSSAIYSGTAGGTTSFAFGSSTLNAYGGAGGSSGGNSPASPASASLATGAIGIALSGGRGQGGGYTGSVSTLYLQGGLGAGTPLGAGGSVQLNGNGFIPAVNTGAGGGGGGAGAASNVYAGNGGNSGGYIKAIIVSPPSYCAYSIGTKGSGGTGSGTSGAYGADGIIIVREYYQ